MLISRKLRHQTMAKAVCLALWFCCGGCFWSGPVAVDRSQIPFLNPAVVDSIHFTPSSNNVGYHDFIGEFKFEAVQINDPESIQWITFWLDDIFHNARAFRNNHSLNMFTIPTDDQLEIQTKYGKVILAVGFHRRLYDKNEYRRRESDFDERKKLDEMYPENQFYNADLVTIQYEGRYYRSLFFPKALIHLKNNP